MASCEILSLAATADCDRSGGLPLVFMRQSAEHRPADDAADVRWARSCAFFWDLQLECLMRPRLVVMPNEVAEHMPQVPLVDHHDVVQTLSAERPDETLRDFVRRVQVAWLSDGTHTIADCDCSYPPGCGAPITPSDPIDLSSPAAPSLATTAGAYSFTGPVRAIANAWFPSSDRGACQPPTRGVDRKSGTKPPRRRVPPPVRRPTSPNRVTVARNTPGRQREHEADFLPLARRKSADSPINRHAQAGDQGREQRLPLPLSLSSVRQRSDLRFAKHCRLAGSGRQDGWRSHSRHHMDWKIRPHRRLSRLRLRVAVMFARYDGEDRDLDQDDAAGMVFLYPHALVLIAYGIGAWFASIPGSSCLRRPVIVRNE